MIYLYLKHYLKIKPLSQKMDNNTVAIASDTGIHKTHTAWTFWYHNPVDKNWDLKSYTKIYEFQTLEDFYKIYNSWDECLPHISEGMFFLMRKFSENNYVNPLWEDKYNRNGGFWSFKINKEASEITWKDLTEYLVSEQMCRYPSDTMMINGISISPKRNFCILKIWNNDHKKCDKALLCSEIPNLSFSECMYKCHNDNIVNDQNKIKKPTTQRPGNNRHFGTNAFVKRKPR